MKEDQKRTPPVDWIIIFVVLVFLLMYVTSPVVIRSKKNGEYVKAFLNARNIGIALQEFEKDYGQFPDETTAAKIRDKPDLHPNFTFTSSNDYLFQLVAVKIIPDESVFYAKSAYTKESGEFHAKREKCLDPGEVGFGYLMNGKSAFTSEGNPSRVILCSPLLYDGTSVSNRLFDPDIHDGMTILLRIDGSVPSPRIDPKTKAVMLSASKSLLDTGPDTIWGSDVTPVIIPPLPAP